MEEEKLVPIYAKINLYELPERDRPMMSFWDIELLNKTLFEENSIKIGSVVTDNEGGEFMVKEISFSFRDYLEDNKHGMNMAAKGPTGCDNLTVNIYMKSRND